MENINKKISYPNQHLNHTMNELIPQFLLNEINEKEEQWSLNKLKEDTLVCDMSENEETHFNIDQHSINQQVYKHN
jgi:hypothetical protein